MHSRFTSEARRIAAKIKAATIAFGSVDSKALSASVQARLIAVSAAIGRFLIFLEKMDEAAISDAVALGVSKPFADLMAVLEDATLQINKGLNESPSFSDQSFRSIAKALNDAAGLSDSTSRVFSKVLRDTASVVELHAILLSKVRVDAFSVTETKSVAVGKPAAEILHLTDALFAAFDKTLNEALALTDRTTLDVQKFLTESLFVTDDLDGAASILDDQTMQFFKNRSDLFLVLDEIAVKTDFFRSFDEALSLTDATILETGKGFNESLALTDEFVRQITFGRLFDEAPTVASHTALDFHKNQDDVYMASGDYFAQDYVEDGDHFFVTDTCRPQIGKGFYETPRFSDQINYRTIGKGLSESLQLSEAQVHVMTKLLTDGFTVTDDLDGQASAQDDQIMSFFKNRADAMAVTDSFAYVAQFFRSPADQAQFADAATRQCGKVYADAIAALDAPALSFSRPVSDLFTAHDAPALGTGKGRTDQATLTDTGSLRSQGYSDFSYFAEDFVGASRTF